MARHAGILEVAPGRFVVQVQVRGKRATTRVNGAMQDAKDARANLILKLHEELRSQDSRASKNGSPERPDSSPCPTLADWLVERYARWQCRAQNERTRRKLEAPKRYLLASDLADKPLSQIGTADVNAYVEWRLKVGVLTFARRKDGSRYKPRKNEVSAQTINKSLKVLSASLRLACDEQLITKVPKIEFLPEDDAKAIVPPTEDEYQALVRGAEALRPIAPLLPEVLELLGEFGLRPGELFHLTWRSIDWTLGVKENPGALRVEEQKRTRLVGGKPWVPKNKKFRIIPFSARGREILERLRAQVPDAKPDDLVIPNEHGLPYIRLDDGPFKGGGSGVWERLREVASVSGVSMRDLRHYFAVQNLMRGVPMTVVSAWMGHSSIELTVKRYGRWAHEAKEQWHWTALREKPVAEVAQTRRGLSVVS